MVLSKAPRQVLLPSIIGFTREFARVGDLALEDWYG